MFNLVINPVMMMMWRLSSSRSLPSSFSWDHHIFSISNARGPEERCGVAEAIDLSTPFRDYLVLSRNLRHRHLLTMMSFSWHSDYLVIPLSCEYLFQGSPTYFSRFIYLNSYKRLSQIKHKSSRMIIEYKIQGSQKIEWGKNNEFFSAWMAWLTRNMLYSLRCDSSWSHHWHNPTLTSLIYLGSRFEWDYHNF